jgi:hypothetical protein
MVCAIKLLEVFLDAEISLFAVIRTMSFVPDIEQIFAPELGQINYFEASGKTSREPQKLLVLIKKPSSNCRKHSRILSIFTH